jgi:hypothetical protein
LVLLTELNFWNCPNVTDAEGIGYYEKYTCIFFVIFNNSIQHLVRLMESDFGNCPNITSNMKQIIIDNMRQIIATKNNT